MDDERHRRSPQYKPEAWRHDDATRSVDFDLTSQMSVFIRNHRAQTNPDVRDQTLILDLLGRINYKILSGKRVYVEVGGVVYKTLYGGFLGSSFPRLQQYPLL